MGEVDLVRRLRALAEVPSTCSRNTCIEAADEIERLLALISNSADWVRVEEVANLQHDCDLSSERILADAKEIEQLREQIKNERLEARAGAEHAEFAAESAAEGDEDG